MDARVPSRFSALHDEEILGLVRHGDGGAIEALITRYRPFVEVKASSFFVRGADRDDVVQEGMIGLCKAIHDFDQARLASFRAFAELCVTRQILSAVKAAGRLKHAPLNNSCSLAEFDGPDRAVDTFDPGFVYRMAKLSALESGTLEGYLRGDSYSELGATLGCSAKAVDNALQRAKRKMGAFLKG